MTASPMFIIEDDDHFRETFIDVMSLKGVEVSGARNGDVAGGQAAGAGLVPCRCSLRDFKVAGHGLPRVVGDQFLGANSAARAS